MVRTTLEDPEAAEICKPDPTALGEGEEEGRQREGVGAPEQERAKVIDCSMETAHR